MPDVLVIGSANADIVVEIDRLPARGETIAARKPDTGKFVPGGKGANQAAAVARLANPSSTCPLTSMFVGQFGHDAHGKALERIMNDTFGIDTSLSGHPDCPSGQAFVFVFPDGENSIVIVGGANTNGWSSPSLPTTVQDAIKSAAIVLLQCEIPASINDQVARIAAQANVPVLYDVGGEDRDIAADLLPALTILCPNETELARLAKQPVNSIEEAIAAARYLQEERNARNILVTLGAKGSVFVPVDLNESVVYQKCFCVDQIVDTTGAGDCFRSAFAVAIAEHKTIPDAMAFAAAASALCVQVAGAMPSMPSAEATMAFLSQRKQDDHE